MTRSIRSTHRTGSGLVCATVVDEHLRIVRVLVPYRHSSADELRGIIDALLDRRRPGAPSPEAQHG